ncbi:hypothetical protein U4I65_08670 [Stenotrophomonas maltophilia]|uniref:hypothetical protein n=1 Tax=Stenotrophomonas maltophilia TaxID=40324 RepID=UPI002ACCF9D1|nr:hypothetical protein [Stenotrophomonas maltophilia]MDZ5815105.1 hypothetical protein [Stenotrophomonas maltophilia]
MAFTTSSARIWPVGPDWSNGVQETLSWATDVLQASATAVTQHRRLRPGPRRSFNFELLANGQARRVADMLLAGYSGAWDLPIWPDGQRLVAPLSAGSISISCATVGRDFIDGGRALVQSGVNAWEVVSIQQVVSGALLLSVPTLSAHPRGARLYPVRRARVQDGAEERMRNDDVGRRSLTFWLDEPSDWPVLSDLPEYLGHAVLERRPDESEDPASGYSRLAQAVDYGTSLPVVHDLPGLALRSQQFHWRLFGRAEHGWYRSLLYTLAGRSTPVWLPSWVADMRVTADVPAGEAAITVEWSGYTLFGRHKPNRRDLRIELSDGSVYYRRITNAVELGDSELLVLNAPISSEPIAKGRIRSLSLMTLTTLASDDVEIDHMTDADGAATSTTGWLGVVPDV